MLMNRMVPLQLWNEIRAGRDLLEGMARMESPRLSPAGFPALNAWSDDDSFCVEAELPGLQLDDLEIYVEQGRELMIKGRYRLGDSDGMRSVQCERGRGAFERRIELPGQVDAQHVEATLAGGVLTVRLPKSQEIRPQRITVRAV